MTTELARKYDAFISSDTLLRQIPRLLGPGLSKGTQNHQIRKEKLLLMSYSWQVPNPSIPRRRSQREGN